MTLAPIFKRAYWSLVALGTLYFLFLSLLLNGWVQRHALYAHKIRTSWWQDHNNPAQFGFLKNQVQPFHVHTPDGEVLYAWHILPLALYARHEKRLLDEPDGLSEDITQTQAFQLLTSDPASRLVINFHGNAGTIAQGWRTDTYRALASGASDKIHVLAVDYRGFGYSSGAPYEQGLITDGIAVVNWALQVAQIPPERIVLSGQSLGTAVTVAVGEHFALQAQIEFAGIILAAGFADIPTLMLSYYAGGVLPILGPLRPYPSLQRFFSDHIQERWITTERLKNLVYHSPNLDLQILHARNDIQIPWSHSDTLFRTAANATVKGGMTVAQIDATKDYQNLEEGGSVSTWTAASSKDDGLRRIRQEVVLQGGHNRIPTYAVTAKAVLRAFKL